MFVSYVSLDERVFMSKKKCFLYKISENNYALKKNKIIFKWSTFHLNLMIVSDSCVASSHHILGHNGQFALLLKICAIKSHFSENSLNPLVRQKKKNTY